MAKRRKRKGSKRKSGGQIPLKILQKRYNKLKSIMSRRGGKL
jgi:hypothetical protein